MEGWACWQAADASLRAGMVEPHVDSAAALALADAAGVPRLAAAELIMQVDRGLQTGLARRRGK